MEINVTKSSVINVKKGLKYKLKKIATVVLLIIFVLCFFYLYISNLDIMYGYKRVMRY